MLSSTTSAGRGLRAAVKKLGAEGGDEQRRYATPRLKRRREDRCLRRPRREPDLHQHLERANWTLRGNLRRMTRLSNGFSRKRANLRAALALFFAYYIFCKIHGAIRMTPAMKAGITRKPWTVADLLGRCRRRRLSRRRYRNCDRVGFGMLKLEDLGCQCHLRREPRER